jgi:hypothetical protein
MGILLPYASFECRKYCVHVDLREIGKPLLFHGDHGCARRKNIGAFVTTTVAFTQPLERPLIVI